jgi:hypothetical protein
MGRRPSAESNYRCVPIDFSSLLFLFLLLLNLLYPQPGSFTGVWFSVALLFWQRHSRKEKKNSQDFKMAHTPHIELSQGKLPTFTTKSLFFFAYIFVTFFMRNKMEKCTHPIRQVEFS